MMTDTPIPTIPQSSSDKILRAKFAESISGQSDQMDKLGQLLITLELAIPGLYATVLNLAPFGRTFSHQHIPLSHYYKQGSPKQA
jgi:hypothetical protein